MNHVPIAVATLQFGNEKLTLNADGAVSGFQLELSGDYIIRNHNLPDGWKFYHSENMILAFNMGGENISIGTLLEYSGDLTIENSILADSHGNGTNAQLNSIPNTYALYNSYPNPFNPITTISFSLPINSDINVSVYCIIKEYDIGKVES